MDIKYSIYIVTCTLNAKQYVGISKNLPKRWAEHKRCSSKYQALHKAIKKYGLDNFVFTHVADAFNLESAYLIEMTLIKEHNTKAPYGYNLTDGGDGVSGKNWTDDEKERKRKSMTSYMSSLTKEEKSKKFSSFQGKHHSEEVKKKISEANKFPKPHSSRVGKENPMYGMSGEKNPFYGKSHSDETKAKMKAAWVIRKAKGWIDPRVGKKRIRETV